jgi:hypothetical protein
MSGGDDAQVKPVPEADTSLPPFPLISPQMFEYLHSSHACRLLMLGQVCDCFTDQRLSPQLPEGRALLRHLLAAMLPTLPRLGAHHPAWPTAPAQEDTPYMEFELVPSLVFKAARCGGWGRKDVESDDGSSAEECVHYRGHTDGHGSDLAPCSLQTLLYRRVLIPLATQVPITQRLLVHKQMAQLLRFLVAENALDTPDIARILGDCMQGLKAAPVFEASPTDLAGLWAHARFRSVAANYDLVRRQTPGFDGDKWGLPSLLESRKATTNTPGMGFTPGAGATPGTGGFLPSHSTPTGGMTPGTPGILSGSYTPEAMSPAAGAPLPKRAKTAP